MASKVDMCNRALTMLGADTIIALTEDSAAARACNVMYDEVREAVLRDHPWNCATRMSTLAQLVDTPTFQFDYAYGLPSDCLRVLRTEDDTRYAVQGKTLLSDESSVSIAYIANIDDPQQYDGMLREAFSLFLAYKLAYAITASTSLAQQFYQTYLNSLARARGADAQEGTAPVQRPTSWVRAHVGRGYRGSSNNYTVD